MPIPPPLPPSSMDIYWVEENGEPLGPICLDELLARIEDGRTKVSGLVWKQGLADWVPANSLSEVQSGSTSPPPLPKSSRFADFFVGVWEVRTNPVGFETVVRAKYSPDGRFYGTQMTRMLVGFEAAASTAQISGKWAIKDLDNERFVLSLVFDSPLIKNDSKTGSSSVTVSLRIIDQSTLQRLEDGAIVYRIE